MGGSRRRCKSCMVHHKYFCVQLVRISFQHCSYWGCVCLAMWLKCLLVMTDLGLIPNMTVCETLLGVSIWDVARILLKVKPHSLNNSPTLTHSKVAAYFLTWFYFDNRIFRWHIFIFVLWINWLRPKLPLEKTTKQDKCT